MDWCRNQPTLKSELLLISVMASMVACMVGGSYWDLSERQPPNMGNFQMLYGKGTSITTGGINISIGLTYIISYSIRGGSTNVDWR